MKIYLIMKKLWNVINQKNGLNFFWRYIGLDLRDEERKYKILTEKNKIFGIIYRMWEIKIAIKIFRIETSNLFFNLFLIIIRKKKFFPECIREKM